MSLIKGSVILLTTSIIGVLLILGCFEAMLRYTTWLDQLDSPSPSYIPTYLVQKDREIFANSGVITKDGYRTWRKDVDELITSLRTDEGCKIVVLGDSFVMGDGLLVENSWPAKLDKKINCHVYPFGTNGLTSLDEFDIYERELADEIFDLLIVGVVSNDLHPRGKYKNFSYDRNLYLREHFSFKKYMSREMHKKISLSKAYLYVEQVTSNIITQYFESQGSIDHPPIISYGYANWEERLYQEDVYSLWLDAILAFNKSATHPTHFLLTPTTVSTRQEKMFSQIDDSFRAAGLNYTNAYPELPTLFPNGFRPREDWANLADGHPGTRQTDLYSEIAKKITDIYIQH